MKALHLSAGRLGSARERMAQGARGGQQVGQHGADLRSLSSDAGRMGDVAGPGQRPQQLPQHPNLLRVAGRRGCQVDVVYVEVGDLLAAAS